MKKLTLLILLGTTTGFVQAQQTNNGTMEEKPHVTTHQPMDGQQPLTTVPFEQESPTNPTSKPPKSVSSIGQNLSSPWYMGVSYGLSYGRTTFASFAMNETHPGFNVGILGGYKINKKLSTEVSLNYTHLTLGATDCCQNLWLGADGNRYFAPLSGVKSYKYKDLISSTNLVALGTHLYIDLLRFCSESPMYNKWSAIISPAIYGVCSKASVKQADITVRKASKIHLGMGIDLGVGYSVSSEIDLRLTTGINYLTGAIDALPREEHPTSYIWNSSLKLIYKL